MAVLRAAVLAALTVAPAMANDGGWYATLYAGRFADERMVDILTEYSTSFEDSYLGALAVGRRFATWADGRLHWEAEGQVAQHFGDQDHTEVNAVLVARWTRFPWDRFLDTSFAFGEGLSYALSEPAIEAQKSRGTARLLNYLLVEAAVRPPGSRVSLVTRIHHRSGVFGLFDGVRGGSNVVALGFRMEF